MAIIVTQWPDNMGDEGAISRLETLLLEACEGNREVDLGRQYKALRHPLIRRDDLRDVVPEFVRAQRDLSAFWAFIREHDPTWKARREFIRKSFRPIFDRLEGRTKPPTSSSAWTGKRSASEQIRIVRALAPAALQGVDELLSFHERTLHNGGPVDPAQEEALKRLRELHKALGDLIEAADAERPLSGPLSTVKALKKETFGWTKNTYEMTIATLPLTSSTTFVAAGVMFLINALIKDYGAAAAIGAAASAAHVVKATK